MSLKNISVANFNTVFLRDDEEYPLLDYFDSIIMPAFCSGITRTHENDKYFFMNIRIVMDTTSNYILTGLIVKKTVLEIKSDINKYGELITLDHKYPSAPFSIFTIYLKNHRMLYVKNQKGSPRLDSFRSTVKYVIDKYVREKNASPDLDPQDKLPIPLVNVVGIPPRKSIEKELKELVKIRRLTLRFYPLNGDGDIDFVDMFSGLSRDCRKAIGSKHGEIVYTSPQNLQGVIDLLSKTHGTVEPTIKGDDANNVKRTIKNDQMTETMDIEIDADNFEDAIQAILLEGQKIDSLNYVSKENAQIYERNLNKIIPFKK